MLVINPKLYLGEIRDNLCDHLGLRPHEIPSLASIHEFLKKEGFTRKKCTKVALERFSATNMMRTRAFTEWRRTVDPRKLFFVDETGFSKFWRTYGRIKKNQPIPIFASKIRPKKTSVIAVTGFHGTVLVIPFHENFTAAIFEYAMEHIILPVLPNDCYIVMDNALIHNDDRLEHILAQRNITLVKLPLYSYDLNPIEMVFSLAKIYSLHHNDIDDKAVRIVRSFNDVTPLAIQNFYRRSWRIQYLKNSKYPS